MSPLIGKPTVGLPSDEVSPDPPQADKTQKPINNKNIRTRSSYVLKKNLTTLNLKKIHN